MSALLVDMVILIFSGQQRWIELNKTLGLKLTVRVWKLSKKKNNKNINKNKNNLEQ